MKKIIKNLFRQSPKFYLSVIAGFSTVYFTCGNLAAIGLLLGVLFGVSFVTITKI
jgi:hypothetical protein